MIRVKLFSHKFSTNKKLLEQLLKKKKKNGKKKKKVCLVLKKLKTSCICSCQKQNKQTHLFKKALMIAHIQKLNQPSCSEGTSTYLSKTGTQYHFHREKQKPHSYSCSSK